MDKDMGNILLSILRLNECVNLLTDLAKSGEQAITALEARVEVLEQKLEQIK